MTRRPLQPNVHFRCLGSVLSVEELRQASPLDDVYAVVVEPGGVAGDDDVVLLGIHGVFLWEGFWWETVRSLHFCTFLGFLRRFSGCVHRLAVQLGVVFAGSWLCRLAVWRCLRDG